MLRGRYEIRLYVGAIVDAPNCRLRPVLNAGLAKYRLDVDLHSGLRNVDLARYVFVGVAFDDTAQNQFLPR